jgi:trehalose/maltose hydrolase-like predicted phosphorylase
VADRTRYPTVRGPERPHGLDQTFEAIIFDWDAVFGPDQRRDASPFGERIESLCAAGVQVIAVTDDEVGTVDEPLRARPRGRGSLHICCERGAEVYRVDGDGPQLVRRRTARLEEDRAPDRAAAADASLAARINHPNVTDRAGYIEIGLIDTSDSSRWAAGWLAAQGITGGLVLIGGDHIESTGEGGGLADFPRAVVIPFGAEPGHGPDGVEPLGGGLGRFVELCDHQLQRRAAIRVPNIDLDPAWVLPLPTARSKERIAESLATLGNGWVGVRGSRDEDGPGSGPLFLVSDVFTPDGHLLPGPNWAGLERPGVDGDSGERRVLDLRGGTLVRLGGDDNGGRSLRFVSAALPCAMALRAEGPEANLQAGEPLRAPVENVGFEASADGDTVTARTGREDAEIEVAARDRVTTGHGRRVVERLAAWAAGDSIHRGESRERLAQVDALGFDCLLADHRAEWAHRWNNAEIVIEGDPEAQLAARFAVFHLLNAASDLGEAAVGARGLTGNAYAGHVFWDADVFVLPALAAIRPAAARAMLEYRIRRLPAARAAAEAQGMSGARFPWESARDGRDVTPRMVRGRNNELIPIETGLHQEHIVADVAWAAAHYTTWTGDSAFPAEGGRDLVIDTARYWASRVRTDADGNGHLYGMMGPDEYHEVVNDNAYTNIMARWNLRHGADLLFRSGDTATAAAWRVLADGLVDGWNPDHGLYEQFAGYFELEPLLISQFARPPVAADALLGADRVAGSQLIKQADVLMLHHLVPDEVVEGSLRPCLDFYGPRTAHGSSLSPAIHASLLARAGEPEAALELFRLAAHLDLDDLTGSTADGLHLATMGGVWQALAFGFLGMRAKMGMVSIDPCLPETWSALSITFRFGGKRLAVRAEHDRVIITCREPLLVEVADQPPQWCQPGTTMVANPPTT